MAGIIKRGNKWVALYYLDGKQVRKSTGVNVKPTTADGTATARELKKLAQVTADSMEGAATGHLSRQRALDAVLAAAGGAERGLTLEHWAHEWLKTQRLKKSYKVCHKAITRFLDLLPERVRSGPLRAVTPAHCDDWANKLLDTVSGSTVDRDRAEVSAMFNRAVREEKITSNPCRQLRLPAWAKAETQEREIFTTEQLKVMFEEFPGEWPEIIATDLLLGGLRLGEVATLQWSQVDFKNNLVLVTTQKTNRSMRKPLVPALRTLLERRKNKGFMAGAGAVFPFAAARVAQAGGKTSKLSVEFGKLLEEHGLRSKTSPGEGRRTGNKLQALCFHSLRGTAVTFLLDGGVPPDLVRVLVGHDDKRIERDHYYKPAQKVQAAAMEALGKVLGIA